MPNILSSDILERQFGPTEVKVFKDETVRVPCTRVISSGQILEISRVSFVPVGVERFPDVHERVLEGNSMGKVFREMGVEFHREEQAAYTHAMPKSLGQWFGSEDPATVVAVTTLVGPDQTPYSEIVEVYSPAVVWPRLTGGPQAEQLEQIGLLDRFLSAIVSPD